MAQAGTTDVAARIGRALTSGETTQVDAYLEDAEAALLRHMPQLLVAAAGDPVLAKNIVSVECSIALRAARITDAVQAAYPNTESWTTSPGYSRANVTVLDSEWRKLGLPWYSSFSFSQNASLGPGAFPDMNPEAGPWWVYGESD